MRNKILPAISVNKGCCSHQQLQLHPWGWALRKLRKETKNTCHLAVISGEGNGTPLQYSCLENSMDGGALWAAVHEVTQSWSRLRLHFHFSLSSTGEGNGNPLQCSCLENPRDRGAWWAAVYGVTQSRTQLKWLSSSSIYFGEKLFQLFWKEW